MKKFAFGMVCFAAGILLTGAVAGFWFYREFRSAAERNAQPPPERFITGYGYIRGRSRTPLKNKYGAFVSKVHFFSDTKVKKGDCILEYDDFDLRKKILSVENAIADARRDAAAEEIKLSLTRLDPLPSDFRNSAWKAKRAEELLRHTENELYAYERLYRSKSVSELDLRSKKQACRDAFSAYQIAVSDQEKVRRGLSNLKIRQAEESLARLKVKLAGLEKELALLNEERRYYRIVTPYDGVIVTNSDTVHAWNAAGTEAAAIHRVHRGFYVYSYFEEKDILFIPNGTKGRFFSNDTGKWYDLISFDVTPGRTACGDKVFHLVKFKVVSSVDSKVTLDSTGVIKIRIP